MTYTVSGGALNCAQSNMFDISLSLITGLCLWSLAIKGELLAVGLFADRMPLMMPMHHCQAPKDDIFLYSNSACLKTYSTYQDVTEIALLKCVIISAIC